MNKLSRAINNARNHLSYSRPIYIEGYNPTPWRKVVLVLVILIVVAPFLIAHFFFHNKDAIPGLFTLLWIASLVSLVWGLIAPLHFSDKILSGDKEMSRRGVATIFGLLSILFFILIGVTAPAKAESITTKARTETKPVHYSTTVQYDDKLSKGQTHVLKDGVDGVETYTYKVTYSNGKEIRRSLQSKSVTTQPISRVNSIGTYVAPVSSVEIPASSNTSGSGYTNVDGVHIDSPSSYPAGASAQCVDGSYSYSVHRQGTCSHHGGVARWL